MHSKSVRVSSRGQIVLPKKIRDQMGVQQGDYIQVEQVADNVLIIIKQENSIESILTRFRKAAKTKNFTRADLSKAIEEFRSDTVDSKNQWLKRPLH